MHNKNTIKTLRYESPCGQLLLGSLNDKLCLCDWAVEARRSRVDGRLKRWFKADFEEETSEALERSVEQLDEYFTGKRKLFDIQPLYAGTCFQQKVWGELLNIPFGQTVSYGEIARRIGMPNAVRAVANAIGANAISVIVPCHRVVGGNGLLTGYAGGLDAKRRLLELEGVAR